MRETLGVLRRGVWLILLLMVAAATGGIWHSSTRAKTYEATSLLVVRPVLAQASFGSGQFGIRDAGPLGLELSDETHARLITSGTIAERVAKALKLKTPPEELASEVKAGQTSEQLIGIRATSEQPRLAAALADAFADEYLASRREEATRVVEIAASELTREADEMQKRLDKLDADILKLAAEVAVLPAPVAVAVPPGGTPPPTASPQQAAERASKEASIRRFTTERNDVLVQVTTLRAKVQDLRLGRILSNGGEVVERAEVPEAPLGPGMPLIAVAASVLGGALGAAFLLLRRYFDTRVRTREDVIRSAPVPVLAVIPRPRRPRRGRPAASKGDPLYPAEAYRFLRANLVTRGLGSTLRRLAVISPIPSETRASVVANLAMECALAGLRTVVVCADLRRPGLQALFPQTGQAAPLPGGLPDHVGLTLVVRDIETLENALLPTD
ncbi:MAG: YveK family protein, partial [Actinomycetota bacterium]